MFQINNLNCQKRFLSNNYSCLRNHTLQNKVFKEAKCAKNKQVRLQAKFMHFNVIHGTIGLRGGLLSEQNVFKDFITSWSV